MNSKTINPRWKEAPMEFGYVVSPHVKNHNLVKNDVGLYVDRNQPPLRATEDGKLVPPFIETMADGTTKEIW
jgi:hypothetical protein